MGNIKLIQPDIRYKDSYVAAMREGLHLEPAEEKDILLADKDFYKYMEKRHDLSRKVTLPDGTQVRAVRQLDLWLVDGERFLGMASLRPELNDNLLKRGGNIGYAVRASERKKGYGRMILDLTLKYAETLGLEKVLITCHDENLGSIQIIEGAGGVLQDVIKIWGLPIPERRYWITIKGD
jgi:predicted acetyltransferase